MKQNQLDRIIKLVRRTGDRFVIMDKDTEETMVLMNLNEYESLLNDTSCLEDLEEEDMLNKLNHDISRWQVQKNRQSIPDWEETVRREPLPTVQLEEILPEEHENVDIEEVEEIDENEDDEFEDVGLMPQNEPMSEPQPILEPIVEKALEPTNIPLEVGQVEQTFGEENLSGLPEDEEEKFYLEPIE